jgi:energy-coupling factor transport system ATP-binding protein
MRDAALGFEGRWALQAVDLVFEPGTLTLVTGATGSGKSTLLQSLSGLFQHVFAGEQRGEIEVGGADRFTTPPRDTAGFVGVVAQSVRLSFVAATVSDELGFALAIRDVAPEIVRARVTEIAAELDIQHLLDREVVTLSAGEACLVAIGAAIVSRPVLLLVDEPLAELDAAARERVVAVLDRLAHDAGVCVVVAEHAFREWNSTPDVRLELRDDTVMPAVVPVDRARAEKIRHQPAGAPVAIVEHLTVTHAGEPAVDDVSLTLLAGELVALRGPNGAGKSSLLHGLARPARPGTVVVRGVDVHHLRRRARRHSVALVPEAFDDLLFSTTVAAECRRGGDAGPAFVRFLGLSLAEAGQLMSRHPRDLSAGQRLCLVLAIQLAAGPSVILVDEPTRGLDAGARDLVGSALVAAARSGAAVVFATHDDAFADAFSTRTLSISEGRIHSEVLT